MTDLVKRLRACCECEQAPLGPLLCESADLIESQAKEIERLKASERSAWNAAVVRDEEIARLKAGGCARDQGLTQYCAEAADMAKEIARLRRSIERIAKAEAIGTVRSLADFALHGIREEAALKDAR